MAYETAVEQKNKPKRRHRKSHGKISFRTLARVVADSWKQIDATSRANLEAQALLEKQEYLQKVQEWKLRQERKQPTALVNVNSPVMAAPQMSSSTSSSASASTMMPASVTSTKAVSSKQTTATSSTVVSEASSDESSVDSTTAPPSPAAVTSTLLASLPSSKSNGTTSSMNPLSMPKAAYLDFKGVGRGTLHIRHPWLNQRRTVSSSSLLDDHNEANNSDNVDADTIITTAPSHFLQQRLFPIQDDSSSNSHQEDSSSSSDPLTLPMEQDEPKEQQAIPSTTLVDTDSALPDNFGTAMDDATEQAVAEVVSSMMDDAAVATDYPDDLVLQGMEGIDPSLDMGTVFD